MKTIEFTSTTLESIERCIAMNRARQTAVLHSGVGTYSIVAEMAHLKSRLALLELARSRAQERLDTLPKH
jgi:hypothetical protein